MLVLMFTGAELSRGGGKVVTLKEAYRRSMPSTWHWFWPSKSIEITNTSWLVDHSGELDWT